MKPLRFRNQEEYPDETKEREPCKEQEGSGRPERLGQAEEGFADDEIRAPIGNGGDSSSSAAVTERVDLGVDNPWHGSHSGGVGDDVGAEEDDGEETDLARATVLVPCPVLAPTQTSNILSGDEASAGVILFRIKGQSSNDVRQVENYEQFQVKINT